MVFGNWRLGACDNGDQVTARRPGAERKYSAIIIRPGKSVVDYKAMDKRIGGLELAATAAERLPVGLEPSAIIARILFGLDSSENGRMRAGENGS